MAVATLRPNGVGDLNNLDWSGAPTAWECVDESTPDEGTSYVWDNVTAQRDLYALTVPSDIGAIQSIKVIVRGRRGVTAGQSIYPIIKRAGAPTYADGDSSALTESYVNYDSTWNNQPDTGNPWQVSDLDDLQAGVGFTIVSSGAAFCTQVYVEVTHFPAFIPKVFIL